ncbi:MAG: phage integrase SAM-like domain-containing protein [Bacteroidaceae bacterium]|nr:phage integrase SAM-like domain-containing protein [Bacteroidaceae bacterium]
MRGTRKTEGLKLYLVPEASAATKIQNQNTMKPAEQIKARRILDSQKVSLVDWEKVNKITTTLLDYTDRYIEADANLSVSSTRAKKKLRAQIREYLLYTGNEQLPLHKMDKDFCKGFIAFLKLVPTMMARRCSAHVSVTCGDSNGSTLPITWLATR